MKKYITMFILAVVACATTAFAQTPTETLMRIQAETTTGDVTAFFEKGVTIDGKYYGQPWQSVGWNNSTKTVTVGGVTMTYGQVMQFVVAIADQEWAEKKAAEQPVAKIEAPNLFLSHDPARPGE